MTATRTAERTLLLVGRDPREAERLGRLLPLRLSLAQLPSQALPQLPGADAVLLEDRAWPASEEAALGQLRALSSSRQVALVLSRWPGQMGSPGVPVVERPYRADEVLEAVRMALMRRSRK